MTSPAPCACLWCGRAFPPAKLGGKPKVFCSDACRHAFQSACRTYTELMIRTGHLTIGWMRWFVVTMTGEGTVPPSLAPAMFPLPSLADVASRAMRPPAELPADRG